MKRPARRQQTFSHRTAATTVEFAFVAPVVLTLVFGVFELSRVIMVKQALTNAAREGCRTATLATTRTTARAEAVLRDRLEGIVYGHNDASQVRVQWSPSDLATIQSQTSITTTVSINYADVSLLPNWLVGRAELRIAATMKRE